MLSASLTVGALGTFVCQPFDFVKTVIQIRSEGFGIRQKGYHAGYSFNKVAKLILRIGFQRYSSKW